MAVAVQLMGPVALLRDGKPVEVGGPKQLTILSVLALSAGRRVSTERLIDAVWADDPPASARRTVQSYVAALRRTLGAGAPLVSSHGGYVLEISRDSVDLLAFEDTVVNALDDIETNPAAAATALAGALDDWDVPVDGLREGSRLGGLAAPFEELQLQGVEGLAVAQIASSRAVDAVRMLESLVRQHPTREHMWLLLARGLAASGRRDASLTAIHRAREALREHLGVDLSSVLSDFEIELLRGGSNSVEPAKSQNNPANADPSAKVVPSELPAGATVTILFTDIEASTQRWRDDPVSMAAALADHNRTLQRVIETHGGRVFKHTGDGVGAVFWSAAHALDAAREAQDLLELPVRIGLHTGEVIERDGDLYGPTLNRCARIADAGHGGQILISSVTLAVIGDDDVTADVTDLGEHTLKGLAGPERIFQLGTDEFAALRVDHQPSALPMMLTGLVGRDEFVAAVEAVTLHERLVTLLGPGGIGKTSVALTVAERISDRFDLVVFVGLGEVTGEDGVLPAFCQALRLTSPTMDAVAMAVSNRRALVVVDNCEHVVEAAAEVTEQLLWVAPNCRILATSREGLGVSGEHIVVVPGLDTNDIAAPAVDLFLERVKARGVSVVFGSDEVGVVLEICRRVDGLPLAIELAAARIPMLTPSELLKRLTARFEVLTGGRRRSGGRQKTLRTTVDWSYELLDADERDAFVRLSVFAGSFDLRSAEAVFDGRTDVQVLDLLAALADKSLLAVDNVDGVRRYRYLETIRSYAEDRFDETGDSATTMRSLHDHHVRMMQMLVDDVRTRSIRSAADRLILEIPNVRRTFEYALCVGDVDAAAQLIAPVSEVFGVIDWPINGWAAEALALPDADSSVYLAHLLTLDGIDQIRNGEQGGVRSTAQRVLAAAGGYELLPASLCRPVIFLLTMIGSGDLAVEWTMSRLAEPEGFDPTRSLFLTLVMHTHRGFAGRDREIMDAWSADLDEGRRHPSELVRAEAHYGAAILADIEGDFERMMTESRQLLDMRIVGSADWLAALVLVASAEQRLGHLDAAIRLSDEVIDASHRYADRSSIWSGPQLHAIILRTLGEAESAAIIRARFPPNLSGFFPARALVELDPWLDAQLGPEYRHELRARAATMTPHELQAVAHEAERRHFDIPLKAT